MVTITLSAAGAKNAASRLRDFLAADGIALKQTYAYEALAQTLGYANWNTLQALLNAAPTKAAAENHAEEDARSIEPMWVYTAERLAEQAAPRTAITLDHKKLDAFVGCYQFRFNEFLTVTRHEDHLLTRVTYQQGRDAYYPESETKFFAKAAPAQMSFSLDPQNYAESVVLHSRGNEVRANRVDESVARAFEDTLQKYVADNKPTPAREVLLRRLIAAIDTNAPNYEDMTPGLVQATKPHWQATHRTALRLGKLVSLDFLHVDPEGWDVYDAVFENGRGTYKVGFLSPDQKLDLVQFNH